MTTVRGIQNLASAHHSSELPVSKISLSLLVGFVFMFLVEQFTSPHSRSHRPSTIPLHHVEEPTHDGEHSTDDLLDADAHFFPEPPGVRRDMQAYPLTLGLLIHALVDGLALGVSALSNATGDSPDTSWVVFMALFIHKGTASLPCVRAPSLLITTAVPTAIALTTSLLSTTLSRSECKKHLIAFSASTPCGAILSYVIFSVLGLADSRGDWTGIALLLSVRHVPFCGLPAIIDVPHVQQGGSFLYVATVLQPVSHAHENGTNNISQALLVIIGMFLPFAVGSIIGHGHHHHLHGVSERILL
jgi:zinc transporter 9